MGFLFRDRRGNFQEPFYTFRQPAFVYSDILLCAVIVKLNQEGKETGVPVGYPLGVNGNLLDVRIGFNLILNVVIGGSPVLIFQLPENRIDRVSSVGLLKFKVHFSGAFSAVLAIVFL